MVDYDPETGAVRRGARFGSVDSLRRAVEPHLKGPAETDGPGGV
ncbi:hypothetical protein [Halobaculum sp. EA56]